ncbi:MAG: hypothetical protein ACLFV6_07235 [Spirulinaceae cyanobacterium]
MNYLKLDIDLLLNNQEDEVIAIAQIKAGTPPVVERLHDIWLQELQKLLISLHHREIYLEYGFLMDYQQIVVLTISPDKEWRVNKTLETNVLVKKYRNSKAEYLTNNIYLETLFSVWIEDLIYQWKSHDPPYKDELKSIGFLDKIQEGDVKNLNNLKATQSLQQGQLWVN